MSALLWAFAVVGYLGVGVVVAATLNREEPGEYDSGDPLTSNRHEFAWLTVVAWSFMAFVVVVVTVIAAGSFPFRWLYYRLATADTVPTFFFEAQRRVTAIAEKPEPGTSLRVPR